jgi:hypothetical protein
MHVLSICAILLLRIVSAPKQVQPLSLCEEWAMLCLLKLA